MADDWYRRVYLTSAHWEKRRQAARKAQPACEQCGLRYRLDVHHVSYARLWNELPEDLMVLCRTCHENVHAKPKPPAKTNKELRWEKRRKAIVSGRKARIRAEHEKKQAAKWG